MMKKLFVTTIVLFVGILNSNGQQFEGTITYVVHPDSSDEKTQKELAIVESARSDRKYKETMNSSQIVEYLKTNPEQRETVEAMLLITATHGNLITVMPRRYEYKIQGRNTITTTKGGGASLVEAVLLNDGDSIYKVNHSLKTYTAVKPSDPVKSDVKISRGGVTKIAGYNCEQYRLIMTAQGTSQMIELWVTRDIKGINSNDVFQWPEGIDPDDLKEIRGVPMRVVWPAGGVRFIMSFAKITREKHDTSIFKIPADYKRVDKM